MMFLVHVHTLLELPQTGVHQWSVERYRGTKARSAMLISEIGVKDARDVVKVASNCYLTWTIVRAHR
eukprot:1245423-Pyramimonas_sp.AAC.2